MPTTKRKTAKKSSKALKRAKNQHPKHFAKVYWPYLPVIAVVIAGMIFGGVNPNQKASSPSTLAYSTEMSVSGLLSFTNQQRASNGLGPLAINSLLNSSAQAKANDMVALDYWAHTSPGGQEPWVFFDSAGYVYKKAGENLAYGFGTSNSTVIGWMNSPSHRANVLDTVYTEVGFGFANSDNFIATGQETVVVAHYAKPLVYTPPPTTSTAQPTVTPVLAAAPEPEPEPEPAPEPEPEPEPFPASRINQPVTSDTPVPDDMESTNITRLQNLTKGSAPWSALVLSISAFTVVGAWLLKHAVLTKRFLLKGEYFVAHHPLLDLVVVVYAALAVYLSQSSGVVL